MMFYGDFWPNEDVQAFLAYFEKDLTMWPLEPMESEKCQQFHNFLHSGWDAEEWYEEFENLAPEVLTSWATLHKHFCVKWLDASPNILLEIPEIRAPSTCIATITPKAIGRKDAPQLLPPPTVNLQPLNYTPIICKPNSITPNLTQTTYQQNEAWDSRDDH